MERLFACQPVTSFTGQSTINLDLWHHLHYSNVYYKISTHTHTHPFNGPFSWTTRVGRYQKGKTTTVYNNDDRLTAFDPGQPG